MPLVCLFQTLFPNQLQLHSSFAKFSMPKLLVDIDPIFVTNNPECAICPVHLLFYPVLLILFPFEILFNNLNLLAINYCFTESKFTISTLLFHLFLSLAKIMKSTEII